MPNTSRGTLISNGWIPSITRTATTWRAPFGGTCHILPPRLAGFKRTGAKKSLAWESCQQEHGPMFTVHCDRHGARVILTNRSITGLVNTAAGIELHWRCPCGGEGIELLGQDAVPLAS